MAYKTHDGFGTPQALMEYCAGLMASASGAEEARSVLDAERDVVDLAHLDRMIDKLMVYREPI